MRASQVHAAVVEAGMLPTLVSTTCFLNISRDGALKQRAFAFLHVFQVRVAVVKAGALPALVTSLRDGSVAEAERAARALASLAAGSRALRDAVVAAGALAPLLAAVRSFAASQGLVQQVGGCSRNACVCACVL